MMELERGELEGGRTKVVVGEADMRSEGGATKLWGCPWQRLQSGSSTAPKRERKDRWKGVTKHQLAYKLHLSDIIWDLTRRDEIA